MDNINFHNKNKLFHSLFPENVNIKEFDEKAFTQDCPNYIYQPIIREKANRIVVIGDIHGDMDYTINCFKKAKLINDKFEWIGGDTVVVQVGDQVDRCRPFDYKCDHPLGTQNDENSDIKILKFFTNINKDAVKNGGAVYSLYGNHELMNVMGNLNYVSHKGLVDIKEDINDMDFNNLDKDFRDRLDIISSDIERGKELRKYIFSPGKPMANFLACTRYPAIIVGSFLFVHAGITPEFIKIMDFKDRNDLYKINFAVRKWLLDIIDENYVDKIIGSKNYSMFWHRILGGIPSNVSNKHPDCVKYLDPVLDLFKVGHIFIGHTPQYFSNTEGPNGTCDKKLWRVDTGGSDAFNKFISINPRLNNNKNDINRFKLVEILNDSIIKIID